MKLNGGIVITEMSSRRREYLKRFSLKKLQELGRIQNDREMWANWLNGVSDYALLRFYKQYSRS